MQYVLNFVLPDGGEGTPRQNFIKWMAANVGTRGKDWAIGKPRGDRKVIRVRIADKAHAALVRMMYSEHEVRDSQLHHSYIR